MERVSMSDGVSGEPVEGVYLTKLADGEKTSMQQFTLEAGATVPEHSHPHEQIGFVYEGEITLYSEDGEPMRCQEGDSFVIPGGEPHSAENTGDVEMRGIDIFSPPRTDPDWAE